MDPEHRHICQSDTIALIRALLTTHKEMYTLEEFLRDFEEDGGYSFPSYGYGSVVEFLKSIPDTVTVIPVKNTIYLKVIVNPKFAHIRDMVMNEGQSFRRRRNRRNRRRQRNARKEKKSTRSEQGPEISNE